MGFTGLTFTDGMAMKGVSNQPDMSVKALLAGNDVILGVINQEKEFQQVKQAVEKGVISPALLEEKVRKILTYKYILGVHHVKPIDIRTLNRNIHAPESEWTQRKIYDKAITLVKNNDSILPVRALDKNRIAAVAIGTPEQNTFQKWLKKYAGVNTFQVITSNGDISEVRAKGRITKLTDEKGNSCNYDFKHLKFKITEDGVDKWIYTFRNGEEDLSLTDTCRNNVLTVNNYEIKSETVTVRDNGNIVTLQGTLSDNNFGTINSNFNFSGTANKLNVSRTLENVTFKEDSTIDEVAIRSLTNVTFNESFSRTTFHSDINDVDFDTTVYALLYDNEKVKDVYYNNNTVSVICIPDIAVATSGIPAGTIVMYNGTSGIPAGWAICDGTEGTPNLTGNFIKASETAGETGEFIPASSGSSTETPITYYSLVFIMKLA